MKLFQLTIEAQQALLRSRKISAVELCQAQLDRIQEVEERVHAFITVDGEGALKQAQAADRQLADPGSCPPLTGIPVALKDNFSTRDLRTTCGSQILAQYRPLYDATAVARLRQSGAVILGKTNCDEFAMGSSTENSSFYPTRNPWDLERVPGGSSGGSAVAVACGQAAGAFGSDTGGSIRQPAALSGVVGMKPTYGRVSRYGLVAFASSLDQIGPFARTVRDAAVLLQAVSGHDPQDSTSVPIPVPDYLESVDRPVRGLRIGLPRECFGGGLDAEVAAQVRAAVDRLVEQGCAVEEVSLPHSEYAIAAYYIIAPAEASANLARYDGVRYGHRAAGYTSLGEMYGRTRSEGFGAEVKRRIMVGTYVLSSGYYDAYYLQAQKVRTLIRRDYEQAFAKVDLIVSPTSPTLAFRIGERADDPLAMYLSDIFTVTGNLAGIPGISVPCGFSKSGLPVGLLISGRHFDEARVLQLARAVEQSVPARPLPLASE